ncbi:MAG: M1 family metallopeptidase [Lewinellaceae bacterium]|nr:M1 family metallopeptidase [Lewinellaceae bacterium]
MKHLTLLVLFALTANTLAIAQDEGKSWNDLIASEQRSAAARMTGSLRSSAVPDNYDLKYHRLEWDIDPAVRFIAGTVTSYFEVTTGPLSSIQFDLVDELAVQQVKYHNQLLSFQQYPDERVEIFLPAALPAGRLDSVSITYNGVPPRSDFGSFSDGTHNGAPIIWTLSEPYGARDWWPCKQNLNDKIDSIDVWVRTPKGQRVASNGLLVGEQQEGQSVRFHWKHRYPIPAYLIAIGVTNYSVYSDFAQLPDGKSLEILNYVYPESEVAARQQTAGTAAIMSLFNNLFGTYPFAKEKYGHAMFGFGGGMEHQTMSFMGGFNHLLIAHELAHQWFGDKVTCGSWRDIWLNEGFATYAEGLTYAYGLGNRSFPSWLVEKIISITSNPGGSVIVPDTTNVSRIFSSRLSYNKGAMVLHMLRWKLGDAAFYQGLRNYQNDVALAYNYARTTDLQGHLEATSGQNLQQFFQDWIYGQGYPSYEVLWGQGTNNQMEITLNQTTSHPSVSFFALPVPLHLIGSQKDTTLIVDHRFSGQTLTLPVSFPVEQVEIDPDHWLLSARNTVTRVVTATEDPVLAEVTLAPNPARSATRLILPPQVQVKGPLQIRQIDGRLMRTETYQPDISLRGLPAGSYWILLPTQYGMLQRQVIVER